MLRTTALALVLLGAIAWATTSRANDRANDRVHESTQSHDARESTQSHSTDRAQHSGGMDDRVHGQGGYLLGPEMPTVFTIDRQSISCSVSWGTLGGPAPGPFTSSEMGIENGNFGMVVYSVEISEWNVSGNEVTAKGRAVSITTVNDSIVENEIYDFQVHAIDGGATQDDSFSMTLYRSGGIFDAHTFAPIEDSGLLFGDVSIK